MTILLPFFVAALSLIFFLFLLPKNRKKTRQLSPGPKGLPLIGNLHQFPSTNLHIYLYKLAQIYGPITFLRLGCKPTVVIQSAKAAKEVLKTQDHNFCSRPSLIGQQKLSYNGFDLAFIPYNAYFKEMRKISVVHLLSSKRVHSFAPIRRDEILRMIDKISSLSLRSKIVNLSDLLMTLTSSVISRIAFGKRYEDEGTDSSRFHKLLQEGETMLVTPFFSDYLPLVGYWLDKLTGKFSRLERVFKELDMFYDQIIREHLLHQDKLGSKFNREDIIDVLLQLRKERTFAFELTLDHVKAVLMNIIMAGTDTSAIMVIWAMSELIKNTMAMKKVQEELRSLVDNKSFVEEDDLPKFHYLKAVVKETFRLHPAAPLLIPREALQKCTIEGYDILPKTLVFVNVWAIGRDPKVWKDPEMFIPERFLGSKSSIDFRGNDFELIPFGAGRRMCPGILLGVANVELTLANLLYTFDWKLPNGMTMEDIDNDVIPGISMPKKNPLCLLAKKYS